MGLEQFTPGEVPPAAKFNSVATQSVPQFPTAANRQASWPAPPLGARSVLSDQPGATWYYNGQQWLVQHGAGVRGRNTQPGIVADGISSGYTNQLVSGVSLDADGVLCRVAGWLNMNVAAAAWARLDVNVTNVGGSGFYASAPCASGFKTTSAANWPLIESAVIRVPSAGVYDFRVFLNGSSGPMQLRDGFLQVEDLGTFV